MDSINRFKFTAITECLGRVRNAVTDKIGDTSKNPAALLWLENALTRLRGATTFHDKNTAKEYLHFNTDDNIGLGLQNTRVESATRRDVSWPRWMAGEWNPSYGPPTTESWEETEYHGWKTYPVNIPEDQQERLNYDYPTKYNESVGYSRIKLWNNARFISFYCDDINGYNGGTSYASFILTPEDIEGIKIDDPTRGIQDIAFYTSQSLVQQYSNGWKCVYPLYEDMFAPLNMYRLGCKITKQNDGNYKVNLNIPFISAERQWTNGTWWHVVMYWGSTDEFDTADAEPFFLYRNEQFFTQERIIKWPKKNYLRNEMVDNVYFADIPNVTDGKYIKANERTHYLLQDGGFSDLNKPERYPIPYEIPKATSSDMSNNFVGYVDVDIAKDNVVPVILCVKTGSNVDVKIVTGPELTPEFFPNKWENCAYFPPVPQDYVLLAKYIICRTDSDLYGVPLSSSGAFDPMRGDILSNSSKIAVAWMEQVLPSYVMPKIKDEKLYFNLLLPLKKMVEKYRNMDITKSSVDAAFEILVPALNMPENAARNVGSLTNPDLFGSKVFRGLIKHPISSEFRTISNDALSFDKDGRDAVSDLTGLPPTTELLRLDANKMYLTGENLKTPSKLEIYQPYTVLNENASDRVSLDYTLRLELLDSDENVLIKNWYIMASKYLVSQEEYAQQEKTQEGVAGYFTPNTLNNIEEWRIHGYAGVVPDLSMGQSRVLDTRQVQPPDDSQITQEQYEQQLRDMGMSEKDIHEYVLEYIEDGGHFYTIDTNHYPNYFVGVKNASLAITQYTTASERYWTFDSYYNNSGVWDSFAIAQEGLSLEQLEQFGSNSNDVLPLSNYNFINNLDFVEDVRAFSITADGRISYYVNEIRIKLRLTAPLSNTNGYIKLYVYSDGNGPLNKVADGGVINYSELSTQYQEFTVSLPCLIESRRNYWIVLEKNGATVGGTIQINTSVEAQTDVNNYYMLKSSLIDNYHTPVQVALLNSRDIEFSGFSSNVLTTSNSITSVDGIELMQGDRVLINCLTGDNAVYNGVYNYIDEFNFRRAKDASTSEQYATDFLVRVLYGNVNSEKIFKWIATSRFVLNSTFITFTQFDEAQWVADNTHKNYVWRKLSNFAPSICAAFNREDSMVTTNLAVPNKVRQISGDYTYSVESFWNFTIQKFDTPQKLAIYPRAAQIDGIWTPIPNNRDIHVHTRLIKGNTIIEAYQLIPAGNTDIIELLPIEVDGIVYMSVAKGDDMKSVKLATTPTSIGPSAEIDFNSMIDNTIITNNDITTIDGSALQDGDRILIKDFTSSNAKYNGVYVYDATSDSKRCLHRATDMDENIELFNGLSVRVREGSQEGFYSLTSQDDPIVLNTSNLVFDISIPNIPNELKAPNYGAPVGDKLIIRSV